MLVLMYVCIPAAKLGITAKGKGGFLQRAFSGRKAARSDYEEQQMLLGLKAVEKMKQMVLVRPSPCHSFRVCPGKHIMPVCLKEFASYLHFAFLLELCM